MTASELLARAKALYRSGVGSYRDTLLDVGRVLHEYIMASLAEGDGLCSTTLAKEGITRRSIVRGAADALGVEYRQINILVIAAMTADLLGGGECGDLSHTSVLKFHTLVRRRRGTGGRSTGRPGGPLPSESEAWGVRARYAQSGPALFRRAVAECWSAPRAREEVNLLVHGKKRAKLRARKFPPSLREHLRESASRACPGDVAELCLELIEASEAPAAVAMRLRADLEKYSPAKGRRPA